MPNGHPRDIIEQLQVPKKRISTIKKGYRVEKRCEDELKERGYLTWKSPRVKYCKIDLFGLFDILALHSKGKDLLFIQCKANKCENKTRDAIRSLKMPKSCCKEIWIWKDRRGWVKEYYE